MDSTETKLPVTRQIVFDLCDQHIEAGIVPKVKDVKHKFDRPSSPKLGVYMSEWKEQNAARLDHSASYWRNLAQGLISKCDALQLEIDSLKQHLNPVE